MSNTKVPMASHDLWLPPMQQQIFRDLLHVFSYPGRIVESTLQPLTWLALLATLTDGGTTLADPHGLISADAWLMLEANADRPGQARFIVADGHKIMDFQPVAGTLESPETGATLLLRVASLGLRTEKCLTLKLSGPGIQGHSEIFVHGLHQSWLLARQELAVSFPLGIDILLCDDQRFAALPRSTRIETGALL